MTSTHPDTSQRGPAEHAIREQIVVAAGQHFSRYGYDKTTVSDLAEAIGFSKAYIYKFFNSKQAIAEAICTASLGTIVADIETAIAQARTPTDKLRKLLETAVSNSVRLFFNDRKLYDIAAHSCGEGWSPSVAYTEELCRLLAQVVLEGRQAGEFERKTPLDDTVHGIMASMSSYLRPLLLQYNLDSVPAGSNKVIGLILRSLAP
ncbi:TetR/AcrR family transcriptional regulator [Nevskia sp.]|uniref:TetR/AcrR family transcriptional regulator n=1 Tax=Nevskia sp. TaxID=1929292 RepID=UPI0025E00790|nr:TetR/AcrR family transcriptional regulator [Nevskia sp.]